MPPPMFVPTPNPLPRKGACDSPWFSLIVRSMTPAAQCAGHLTVAYAFGGRDEEAGDMCFLAACQLLSSG